MDYSLTKIANELGVSKATVSFVLSGKAREMRISEEVEKRVKDFCREVNYVPNIHAQRMNKKLVGNIGFLVNQSSRPGANDPFSDSNISGILGGIVIAAEKAGFRVSIQLYNSNMDERRVFDWLRNREVDGLIYYGLNMPESWEQTFTREGRCIVGIGTEPDNKISSVNIDNFEASAQLACRLIDSGRRSFAYLSGIEGTFVSDERKRGFLAALSENKIEIKNENIICADYSESEAEKKILERVPKADAIVCANDDMAIGAIKALRRLGISVPHEIAVAGADNITAGTYVSPSLTTFDNRQRDLGASAVECVMRLLGGGKPESVVLESKIIVRASA